jgi:hypothetical protein
MQNNTLVKKSPRIEDISLRETLACLESDDIGRSDITIDSVSEQMIYNFIMASTKYARKFPIKLFPYQLKFIHDIIDSTLAGSSREIVGLFSRQSGKTESVGSAAYMLACISHLTTRFADGIRIGIFGPKKDQSDLAFERVLSFFDDNFARDILGVSIVTRNATTLKLSNRSVIKSITASKNATIEGETMDLIFIEEAQDVVDIRLLKSIFPMLASTEGTRVLTGTPTPEHTGYFFYASRKPSSHVHINPWQVGASYSERYSRFVMKEIKKHGPKSDYIITQFECEWLASSKKFTTPEKLMRLSMGSRILEGTEPVFIGVDPAKLQDPTVCTVMTSGKKIINWMELDGDNYNDQLEFISKFIEQYPNCTVGIDTLGPGEVLYDMLSLRFPNKVFRYPMSTLYKSTMFVALKEAIDNNEFGYPLEDCPEKFRFEEQMIELDAKWNGNVLSARAPQGRNKHDDFPCSAAICVIMVNEGTRMQNFEYSVGKKSENSGRKVNQHRSRYRGRY